MLRWVSLALLLGFCLSAGEERRAKTLSRGWGESITWEKSYKDSLAKMVKSRKPLMVIHHRVDCPHSEALRKAFVADKAIQKMAKEDFVMLNLVDETKDKNLAPDGYYVPRILFVDPSRTVRANIAGRFSNRRYTYGPDDMALLAKNMKKAKVLMHIEL